MPGDLWDERAAALYDATSTAMYDPAVLGPTVDLLAGLAGGGRALELAVGTGRVAIALAERGVPVHGIDLSQPMLDELRRKDPGGSVATTCGDMATTRVDGTFSLVFVVFNSISNLLTQDEQVATFRNAAAHLAPGGRFLTELWIPDLRRLPPGTTQQLFDGSASHVAYDEYDVAAQRVTSHHWFDVDGRLERFRSNHRWIWPSELDLMASLAGMRLVDRWAGWDRSPFTAESRSAVSVWETT